MSTLTTKKPSEPINFLINGKTTNWRYRRYEDLQSQKDESQETTYWIGIIDLIPVRKQDWRYQISFVGHSKLIVDQYDILEEDGHNTGKKSIIKYHLQGIIDTLLKYRDEGFPYFHVFIEEAVNHGGAHEVSILYSEHKEGPNYGIATKDTWNNMPCKDWISYSKQYINEGVKRLVILGNDEYRWMK